MIQLHVVTLCLMFFFSNLEGVWTTWRWVLTDFLFLVAPVSAKWRLYAVWSLFCRLYLTWYRICSSRTSFIGLCVWSRRSLWILCCEIGLGLGSDKSNRIILRSYTLEKNKVGSVAYILGIDIPIGSIKRADKRGGHRQTLSIWLSQGPLMSIDVREKSM